MQNKKIANRLQNSYVRRYVLTEGKEAGIKVVELGCGVMRATINENHGMDIMQLSHRGDNIGFVSKNGFNNENIAFGKRFEGGMLYTCGIDLIGREEGIIQHGTYHTYPARILSIDEGEDYARVCGELEFTSLFGKNLVMKRTITLTNNNITVNDELTNRDTLDSEYCLLYHTNFGYPMLDEGVTIEFAPDSISPCNGHAKKHLHQQDNIVAPIDNEPERCYYIETERDYVVINNEKLGKRVTLSYSKDTLPTLLQWVAPRSYDYALGIEPCTSHLGEEIERKTIKAGEIVKFSLQLEFETI